MANAFSNFINDIRQKVVEEPWFGRAVTDNDQNHDKQHEQNQNQTQNQQQEKNAPDTNAKAPEYAPAAPEKKQSAEKDTLSASEESRAVFKEAFKDLPPPNPPEPAMEQEIER